MDSIIEEMAELLKIFADETRIRILAVLREGEANVTEVSEKLEMTHSAVSHQLNLLRTYRLVKKRKEGRSVYYSLDDEHVEKILDITKEHVSHR
ncbi:ArsR/SmtB family transcription factor [Guggenheimella bovis]